MTLPFYQLFFLGQLCENLCALVASFVEWELIHHHSSCSHKEPSTILSIEQKVSDILIFKKVERRNTFAIDQSCHQEGLSHCLGLSSKLGHIMELYFRGGFSEKNQKKHQTPVPHQHHWTGTVDPNPKVLALCSQLGSLPFTTHSFPQANVS